VRAALPTHVAPRRQAWAWTLPSFRRCLRKNQAGRIESPQLAFFWQGLNRVLTSSYLCQYFSLEADFERRI
jgi:hypothetical protein